MRTSLGGPFSSVSFGSAPVLQHLETAWLSMRWKTNRCSKSSRVSCDNVFLDCFMSSASWSGGIFHGSTTWCLSDAQAR